MMVDKHNIGEIDELECTGCGCCIATCPVHAITYSYNNEGFFYPQIDRESCVGCGICYERCPHVKPSEKNPIGNIKVAQLCEEEIIKRSASGGAFFGLAETVLKMGGFVCGCVLNDNMLPVHIITQNQDDLVKMQGSKYVQSRIEPDLYKRIKELLNNNERVLFSGTPCQIDALHSFLNKKYNNLITIGLICHGVAGPGLYLHYIHKIEKQMGGVITNVQFRSREVGAYPLNHSIRIETDKGIYSKQAFNEPYGSNFYHNRILRESCYKCGYAQINRVEDITLGDFNEAARMGISFPSEQGFNILIVNTEKGKRLIDKAKELIYFKDINQNYRQINLVQPTLRPKSRDKLREAKVVIQEPYNLDGYRLKTTLADWLKSIIPSWIKDIIKMTIGRRKR